MKRKLSWLLIALMLITSIPFSPAAYAEATTDLIISEYVEGGSYNKAIEIYNGTDAEVDLTAYSIRKDANGAGIFSTKVQLEGTLAVDDVYIVYHSSSNDTIKGLGDLSTGSLSFNGDDQVALFKEEVEIDHIGVPSTDENFSSSYIKDKTYIRDSAIIVGATGTQNPNVNGEWIIKSKDYFDNLGFHLSVANTKVLPVVSNVPNNSEVALDTVIELSTLTEGATIQVAFYEDDVYGDFVDYTTITVTGDIKFKAKAAKAELTDSNETIFTYTVRSETLVSKIKAGKDAYVDTDFDYLDDNAKVKIEALVTGIEQGYIFAQDDTAGIGIKVAGTVDVSIGDTITAFGQLGSKFDFMYLNVESSADINVLSSDNPVTATIITVAELNDDYEGQLVQVNNLAIGALADRGRFVITGGTDDLTYVPVDTSWVEADTTYESMTGVLYYGYDLFQLTPRSEMDIVMDSSKVRAIKSSLDSGLVEENSTVTLSTLTEGATIYYTTDGSTPTESSSLYSAPVAVNTDMTFKAVAIKTGLDNSDVLVREFTVNSSLGAKTISEIQGEGHVSPYNLKVVEDVVGIVTAQLNYEFDQGGDSIRGFYMQGTDDGNPATSDAIFVTTNMTVAIGDQVTVTGTVIEQVKEQDFYAYDQDNQLAVTTLQDVTVNIDSSNNALPEAVVLGSGGRVVPHDQLSSSNFSTYDISTYAIDFYESLECMRVTVNNPLIVGPSVNRVVTVVPDNGAIALADGDLNIHGGLVLTESDSNTEKLPLNAAIKSDVLSALDDCVMGDKISGSVIGILEYEWTAYQLYLTEDAPAISNPKVINDTYKYTLNDEELRIASYNVYNHGGDADNSKTVGIAKQIVENMLSPDIIGLVEVQDNDGTSNEGIVDASLTYQNFIDEIAKIGGPTYLWTDIEPVNNDEGGQQSGNIRVGFLYNPDRVTLKAGTKGSSTASVTVDADGHLLNNPGRIATDAAAFVNTRKSLAAEFTFNGDDVIVIANHFKSKGGDNAPYGNIQPAIKTTEVKRVQQAQLVNDFIDTVLAANPDANVIALGDLNDYQFSNPAKALAGEVMTNLIDSLPTEEQFSYMYGGNAQILDHIIVSNNLKDDAKVDIININSILGKYNRHSDHDPVIAAFTGIGQADFVSPVTSNVSGDVTVGTSLELSTTTDEAIIYYSLGELSETVTDNILYSTPLVVNETMTITAIAVKDEVKSSVETITVNPIVPVVEVSQSGSVVTFTNEVTDAVIYYSTSELDLEILSNNQTYSDSIEITSATTFKVIAVKGDLKSDVITATVAPITNNTVLEAKTAEKGTEVIVDVIITSISASGAKGFTFQDETAAGYVYTKNLDELIVVGSHVLLKGTTDLYNGQFQIRMTSVELLNAVDMPAPLDIDATGIVEENESRFVTMTGIQVAELSSDKYGTTYITGVKGNQVVNIKLDNRSGTKYDEMKDIIEVDNIITVTGFVSDYKGSYSLQGRSKDDFVVTGKMPKLVALQTTNLENQTVTAFNQNEFVIVTVETESESDDTGLILIKITQDNKVARLGFAANTPTNNGHIGLGFDTFGLTPGTYTVTAYLWSDLASAEALARPVEVTFDIN